MRHPAQDDWEAAIDLAARLESDLAEFSAPAETSRAAFENSPDTKPMEPDDVLVAAFDSRILDSDLRKAARSRFISKHYADAVESGVKALNECIRLRTGRTEDGDALMTESFSVANPLLRINRLKTKADQSAQRGHMQLCQGVIGAWRNPRAHNNLDDAPEKALMMLETVNELLEVSKAAVRCRRRKNP